MVNSAFSPEVCKVSVPNRLLLFTQKFPFSPGEEFIETEIDYLAEAFSEVVVVPTKVGGAQRSLPPNVRVETSFAQELSRHQSIISSIMALLHWRSLLFIASLGLKHAVDPWILIRIGRQAKAAQTMCRWLARVELLRSSARTVAYTYWFESAATGIALYADENGKSFPFVTRCHRFDLYREVVRGGVFPFRQFAIQAIDYVCVITQQGRDYFSREFEIDSDKLRVSRLGVNHVGVNPSDNSDFDISICSCAYVSPVKQLDLLVEAIRLVAQARADAKIRWTHFGGGPDLERIREQVLDLRSNVTAELEGSKTNAEILTAYGLRHFDVFVNCSKSEGLPVSIMEALSFGVPVVAPDIGGIAELVGDHNGKLLPCDWSIRQLSDAIIEVVESDDSRRSGAHQSWTEKVDASRNYAEFAKWLASLVQHSDVEQKGSRSP